MKKISFISISRVLSMLLIVAGHFLSYFVSSSIGQVLIVGVSVFFIISGYLMAGKKITNIPKFYCARYIKIIVPMLFFVCSILLINYLLFDIKEFVLLPFYVLNLEGMHFLVDAVEFPTISGLAHLWFFTIIFICYLFVPFLNKIIGKQKSKIYFTTILIVVILIAGIGFSLLKIRLCYFACFLVGYLIYFINNEKKSVRFKHCIILWMVTLAVLLFRVFSKSYLDDTIIYSYVIATYSHLIFASAIFCTIMYLCNKHDSFANKLATSKFLQILDSSSLAIYIVHHYYFIGPHNPLLEFDNKTIPIIGFFAYTILATILLKFISDKIIKLLFKKIKWLN